MAAPPETLMRSLLAELDLQRVPVRPRDATRAWDAADVLVLDHLADRAVGAPADGTPVVPLGERPRCLVVGDRAGAISTALAAGLPGAVVAMAADSCLAHRSLAANLQRNGLPADAVAQVPWTADLATAVPGGPLDLLVVKVPRSTEALEDLLRRVRPALAPATVVVGAGMTRHVHTSTSEAFARAVGPTRTSLAHRKARLLHARVDPDLQVAPPAPPAVHVVDGVEVVSLPGTFAQGRVDQGTRLLLDHLPAIADGARVIDLGCGDGVVGLVVAARNPTALVTFTDVSHAAIASARAGWARAHGDGRQATFLLGDGLEDVPDGSADLVLVNPPFHDGHAVTDAIAWDMFTGARRALRPGGRLVVVANRHLGHHARLARLFGGCTTLASTPSFVLLEARRTPGREDPA